MTIHRADNDPLHKLEAAVKAELAIAESSHQDETSPVSEWIFDPADAQRERAELRSLLSAVESLESARASSVGRVAAGRRY